MTANQRISLSLLLLTLIALLAASPLAFPPGQTAQAASGFGTQRRFGLSDDNTNDIAVGDVNGDGSLDLAVARQGQQSAVYLNDGVGNFAFGSTVDCAHTATIICFGGASDQITQIAIGDLNGDGHLDLVAGRDGQQSSIYLQQPRAPQPWSELAIGPASASVSSIALGDLNADGALDIALGYKGLASSIFLNNRQPTPGFTSVSVGPVDPSGVALAICRINSDSTLDLAIAAPSGGSQVFLSIPFFGSTFFVGGSTFPASSTLACGDLNGDGAFDLVGSGVLALNDGTGILTVGATPVGVRNAYDIALGFLDWDNTLDIYSSYGSTLLNDGSPSPSFSAAFIADNPVDVVAVGDLTGDGLADLISAVKPTSQLFVGPVPGKNTITVNAGLGALHAWTPISPAGTSGNSAILMADMNSDGLLDIVKSSYIGPSAEVWLNNGNESFRFGGAMATGSGSRDLAIGDVNGDKNLDIATTGALYINNGSGSGSGSFTATVSFGDRANTISMGDVNGDGALDLVLAGGPSPLRLFLNDGSGGMTPAAITVSRASTITVAALEDVDHDTYLDIVVGRTGMPNSILHNNGDGTFKEAGDFGQSQSPLAIRTADMNGDGAPDLIVSDSALPIMIYLNDGSGGFPSGEALCGVSPAVICLGSSAIGWNQIAISDIDGDGDNDLISGDGQVYLNDGGGNFTPGFTVAGGGYPAAVATGDLNSDGMPEIALAFQYSMPLLKIFANPVAHATRLPNTPPTVDVQQPNGLPPNGLPRGPRSATPTLLTTPQIAIPFTLADAESDPVRFVRAFYSLDGGGRWLPAKTSGGVNQIDNLATSPAGTSYTFTWDLAASAFFGQSDNVVFRIEAYPSLTSGVSGVPIFQRPLAVGTSTPFRARGAQVRVVNPQGQAMPNAVVFRMSDTLTRTQQLFAPSPTAPAYVTNASGYLAGRGELAPGDQLIALAPVPLPGPYSDAYSQTVRLYATNIITTSTGVSGFPASAAGLQTVTVSLAHPLALFDLRVSLEWDARYDARYMAQLQADLARASELLFQASHGQAALGSVAIFYDKENWDSADIRIYASNRVRPSAQIGGVAGKEITDPTSLGSVVYDLGQVRMGATWNRFGSSSGSLSEDWPRTLVHELGHYLFFLEDNYLGLDAGKIVPVSSCPGLMSDTYAAIWQYQTHASWGDGCAKTFSNQTTGRADWDTIHTFYPALVPPTQPLNTLPPGPIRLPLALTEISSVEPLTPTARLDVPIFYTVDGAGGRLIPALTARAYLFQHSHGAPSADYTQLVPLGRASNDQVLARGARVGDRLCLFEPTAVRFGCETIRTGDEQLTLTSHPDWQPDIQVTPVTSTTLAVQVTGVPAGGPGLRAELYPLNDDPRPAPISLTAVGGGVYRGMFTLVNPLQGAYLHLATDEPTPRWETVTSFALDGDPGAFSRVGGGGAFSRVGGGGAFSRVGGGGAFSRVGGGGAFSRVGGGGAFSRVGGAPVSSAEGDVLLVGDSLRFALGQFVLLQTTSSLPEPPSWATLIGQGYRFTTSPAPNAPDLTGSALSFSYLDSEVPAGEEAGIQVYYRSPTATTWQAIPTTLDTYFNLASIPTQGPGIYALMSSVHVPLASAGWNDFAYPVAGSRAVGLALGSISEKYQIVYSHVPTDTLDPWKVYAPAPAPAWVSDLTELSFGHGYWIYATQATDLLLKGGTTPGTASALSLPPATIYGVPLTMGVVPPTAGQPVEARIGDVVCGRGVTRQVGGQVGFVVKVAAIGPGTPACGVAGNLVTVTVSGQAVGQTWWDNTRAVDLFNTTRVYAPLVRR